MTKRLHLPLFVFAASLFVPVMLIGDGPDVRLQLLNGAMTGLLVWTAVRSGSVPGIQVATAMAIATTGELILSLGWGLYSYRFAAIPWYVPPGHGLFYLLAAESAAHPFVLRNRERVVRTVLVLGSLAAALGLVLASDQWGLLWWFGAVAMIVFTRSGLLVACAWIYTTPLEWLGTWNGNWIWFRDVPGIPLFSGNPPSGVSILYGLLDVLTLLACGSTLMRRLASEVGDSAGERDAPLADAA